MSIPRILVVDDDLSVNFAIKTAIKDVCEVASTTCALSAYKFLSDNKVDLILLDIKMPDINGLMALEEIKQKYPRVTVVMLTAYASDNNILTAKKLGACGFITKPFDVKELRSYISGVLRL